MDPVTVAMRPLSLPQADGKIPYILHISGDFPDPVEPFKTKVIQTLLELTDNRFHHRVISINRVNPGAKNVTSLLPGAGIQVQERSFPYGISLRYAAPPNGILHRTMLEKLADWIIQRLETENRRPDLIVGHKLTIEGVVARRVAQSLRIPYAISIQGNTDAKIASIRFDMRKNFAAVFHDATIVFPFAPWALNKIEAMLGNRQGGVQLLPCPTDLDQILCPKEHGKGLVSVFHLKNYRGKNLGGIARAYECLTNEKKRLPFLQIIGGGTEGQIHACKAVTSKFQQIAYAGALERTAVRTQLHEAKAMILPSLRESFGLVFIEALFAGTPIIYPSGTAVDGYFDGYPFALKVDARDPMSIAEAITITTENEAALKASLKEWLFSVEAEKFTRRHIGNAFAGSLLSAAHPHHSEIGRVSRQVD